MSGATTLVLLLQVALIYGQQPEQHVPKQHLQIETNPASPHDSVIVSWETPPDQVQRFDISLETPSGIINFPSIAVNPSTTGRYSTVLSPLTLGVTYTAVVTARVMRDGTRMRLAEEKTFTFVTSLSSVTVFGVTDYSVGLNVSAIGPLADNVIFEVDIQSEGRRIDYENITTVISALTSRLLKVNVLEDLIVIPPRTYQITVRSALLGNVSTRVTFQPVAAAPVHVQVRGITFVALGFNMTLASVVDFGQNFSFNVQVFDLNGRSYQIKDSVIWKSNGANELVRIFFNETLVYSQSYIFRVLTLYQGATSYWYSTLEPIFLDPMTPAIIDLGINPDNPTESFRVHWFFGPQKADSYSLTWVSLDGTQSGHASYSNLPGNQALVAVDNQPSGMTFEVAVEAVSANKSVSSLIQLITLRPDRPVLIGIDRNDRYPDDSVILRWLSGRGKATVFLVTFWGADIPVFQNHVRVNTNAAEYSMELPVVGIGSDYYGNITAITEYAGARLISLPVDFTFVFAPSAVTQTNVLAMTRREALVNVSLFEDVTQNNFQFLLRDSTGVEYAPRNGTVLSASGRHRLVRIPFDPPLTVGRSYIIGTLSVYNGSWTYPVFSTTPAYLDPLTPSLVDIKTDGGGTYLQDSVTLTWLPGQTLPDSYLIEWFTEDSTEYGKIDFPVTNTDRNARLNASITGLTPGQRYIFRVTALGQSQAVSSLNTTLALQPPRPSNVQIYRDEASPDDTIIVSWRSGRGKVDSYNITVKGSDGLDLRSNMPIQTATDTTYFFTLKPVTYGHRYNVSIASVLRGVEPVASEFEFINVPAAASTVEVQGIAQYSIDVRVTLLDNSADVIDVQVEVKDRDGIVYEPSNVTISKGTGGERLIRILYDEANPLPANREYTVGVRTLYNGTWTSEVSTHHPTSVDPLTPSIVTVDRRGLQETNGATAYITLLPGPMTAEKFLVEWTAVDSSENGSLFYTPSESERGRTIVIPVAGLTPGKQYLFRVIAIGANRMSVNMDYITTLAPARPKYLTVSSDVTNANALHLNWESGGGLADYYNITLYGSNRTKEEIMYTPTDSTSTQFTAPLPPLAASESYNVSIIAVKGDKTSIPAEVRFTFVQSAPTHVQVRQITRYGGELEVTLLGNITENPQIETVLVDNEGTVYPATNDSFWEGTGRYRLLHVKFSESPLPSNRSYNVRVRTYNNGSWTSPVTTEKSVFLDPLTPSITNIDNKASAKTTNTTATITLLPGDGQVDYYGVNWYATDGSNYGQEVYTPTDAERNSNVSIQVVGLVPGKQYVFRVAAFGSNRTVAGLETKVTMIPSKPKFLAVVPDNMTPDDTLLLTWQSGGGKVDNYIINMAGSDGLAVIEQHKVIPSKDTTDRYSMLLPPVTVGADYNISVIAAVDKDVMSDPSYISFTSLPIAPTKVKLKQITRYGGEMEVTLLGNTTENPVIEATLHDNEGTVYPPSNDTEWVGTGRQRLVRVKFSETPLPANRTYTVRVRTYYNGTWTSAVSSEEPVILDPLTPTVMSIDSRAEHGYNTTSATITFSPGERAANTYLLEWKATDGSHQNNITHAVQSSSQTADTISIEIPGLIPGKQYVFRVTAIGTNQTSVGIDSTVFMVPSSPMGLSLEPDTTTPHNTLLFHWASGGGAVDSYLITMSGSDGSLVTLPYTPYEGDSGPFAVSLPAPTAGVNYNVSIISIVNDNVHSPAKKITFSFVPTAPAAVVINRITRYGGELNVTLLLNTSLTPRIEAVLTDSEGNTYPAGNDSVWKGTGRHRSVRVKFSQSPLPANRTYGVIVRTYHNGTWTEPMSSTDSTYLDPLVPSVIQTGQGNASRFGTAGNSYTITWFPGEVVADHYVIKWFFANGTLVGNVIFVPDSPGVDGTFSRTINGLTPGQQYVFHVTAYSGDKTSPAIPSTVTLFPPMVDTLHIETLEGANDFILTWKSSGPGIVDYYLIYIQSRGEELLNQTYPLDHTYVSLQSSFNISLPPLTNGQDYNVSIVSGLDSGVFSSPSYLLFTFDTAAPSIVTAGKISRHTFELDVTLLNATAETEAIEATVIGSNGERYSPVNGTIHSESGTHRIVRFSFEDAALPANESYIVSVRTLSNGTWSQPLETDLPLFVDPLTPSIAAVSRDTAADGESNVVTWKFGDTLPERVLIQWIPIEGPGGGNVTYTPNMTSTEVTVTTPVRGLIPGQTYIFRATAFDAELNSTSPDFVFVSYPSRPIHLGVDRSNVSPDDTVILMWQRGEGLADLHRLSMEGPGGTVLREDILISRESVEEKFTFPLSPVQAGGNYHAKLWAVVHEEVVSYPSSFNFTFAPTAPTTVLLTGLAQYSGEVRVVFFDDVKTDVATFLNVTLTNDEGVVHVPRQVLEWLRNGSQSWLRLWFDPPLDGNRSYTASVQSLVNGTWSYPVVTAASSSVDGLKPTIVDAQSGNNGSVIITWASGSEPTTSFTIHHTTRDGQESKRFDYPTSDATQASPYNISISNLTPGQKYLFQVTATGQNGSSTSLQFPFTLDPALPTNVRIDRSDISPDDSAVLRWEYGIGQTDFFRVNLSSYLDTGDSFTEDITVADNDTSYGFRLSTLEVNKTYHVTLQAVSGAQVGAPIARIFTFAPGAPYSLVIEGVTPYAINMNVSFFDIPIGENFTVRAIFNDPSKPTIFNDPSYTDTFYSEHTMTVQGSGEHSVLIPIVFNDSRLQLGVNYTIGLQTMYKGRWSYGITIKNITLDDLTPAIISAQRDSNFPESRLIVTWVPGTNNTRYFILNLLSNDGTNLRIANYTSDIVDIDQPLSYTFENLTAGQRYIVQLTAFGPTRESSAINFISQMYPNPVANVRIEPVASSNDSVKLRWDYGDGRVDLFRTHWSIYNTTNGITHTEETLPNYTSDRRFTSYDTTLSNLTLGETYYFMIEAVSGDTAGRSVERIFTFAPTSPIEFYLRGITPYAIAMNISLLDDSWENVTIRAVISDAENHTYPSPNVSVWRTNGRHALARIVFNDTRLEPNGNYTVSIQTLYDGTWSYPVRSTISLDSLTPAILDLDRDSTSPDTAFTITWVSGSNVTKAFLLKLFASDGSEYRTVNISTNVFSTASTFNYTFSNLTAGQRYIIQLTAVGTNETATALNKTITMYPASPTNVHIDRWDTADSAVLIWHYGQEMFDFFRISWSAIGPMERRYTVKKVPRSNTENEHVVAYHQQLSNLISGNTYHVKLETVSGTTAGIPIERVFTFAPTSPRKVHLLAITPHAVSMNVSLFGEASENIAIRAELNDTAGKTYTPEDVIIINRDGDSALVLVVFNDTRLQPDRSYSVAIQTQYNGSWGYPMVSDIYLESLTPAVISIDLVEEAPDTAYTVTWVPGSSDTDMFELLSYAADDSQRIRHTVASNISDIDSPLNFTFTSLTPGQKYLFWLTAYGRNTSSQGIVYTIQMHPASPTNVRIDASDASPNDSAVLKWDYGFGLHDSFRVIWSEYGNESAIALTGAVLPETSSDGSSASYTYQLSNLTSGDTYHVRLESVVGDTSANPVEIIFTFAPSAPSRLHLLGITPYSVGMNMSIFGESWENITIRVEVNDTQGNTYPYRDVVIWKTDGRHALARIIFNDTRLPPGGYYTVNVQTLYNEIWSYPVTSSIGLDPLTPAILSVSRDETRPDTALTVTWVPGSKNTDEFLVELFPSNRKGYKKMNIVHYIEDINTPIDYTFADLMPGEKYTVKLTAMQQNRAISALNVTIQLHPALPLNVRVDRWEASPDDSAVLLWEYGDGIHDSFRVTWSTLYAVNDTYRVADILPNTELNGSLSSYQYKMSPLTVGETYRVSLETLSGGKAGHPVEKAFTFAPSAPTRLNLQGITPYSVDMNVSVFDQVNQNFSIRAEVNDTDGNTYPYRNVDLSPSSGRHALIRIIFNETRLLPDHNYTISVQTLYNGTWSYPITSSIALDSLTPAILDVSSDQISPDTVFTVTWVPGSNETERFLVEIFSVDGSEYRKINVSHEIQSTDSHLNYTFRNLTAGQQYIVQLTAVESNNTSTALNFSIQMYPPRPVDVQLTTYESKSDKIFVTWRADGIVDHFIIEGISTTDDNVTFKHRVTGLESVNGTFNQTVPSLVHGESYTVTVKSFDGVQESVSETVNITLYPGIPVNLRLERYDASPNDTLVLSWKSRGGVVDNFRIRWSLSRGRSDILDEAGVISSDTELYTYLITPVSLGERYWVGLEAVVGNLSSAEATVSSTVGPSVNIRGITPSTIDLEVDTFGSEINSTDVTVTVTDERGVTYPTRGMEEVTSFSDTGNNVYRFIFRQPLTPNSTYVASATVTSAENFNLLLISEPAFLDPLTPTIISAEGGLNFPNNTLVIHWVPGVTLAERFVVEWSLWRSLDVNEVVSLPSPMMSVTISELLPGNVYSVAVTAHAVNGKTASSLTKYIRLIPALPVHVEASRDSDGSGLSVDWQRGNGTLQCFNVSIWPEPPAVRNTDQAVKCLPAEPDVQAYNKTYTNLLRGETYWVGINSFQDGLSSEKVWVPLTLLPPNMRILSMKEEAEQGVVITWEPLAEGKIDNVQVVWSSGVNNGTAFFRANLLRGELKGLLPGVQYSIGANAQVTNVYGDVLTAEGETIIFSTEPVPPEFATFKTTNNGDVLINVKPGIGSSEAIRVQWKSDAQSMTEETFTAEQAEHKNISIPVFAGARYTFLFQSLSGGKESSFMQKTVIIDPAPPNKLTLSLGSPNSSSIELSWEIHNTTVQSFLITWEPPSVDNVTHMVVSSSTERTASLSNLIPGTEYNVSIQAISWNSRSVAVTESIDIAPSMAKILYAENSRNTSVEAAWMLGKGNMDVTFIRLYDGNSFQEAMVPVVSSPSNSDVVSYQVHNLSEGSTYEITVVTQSAGVNGSSSLPALVTIPEGYSAPDVSVTVSSRGATMTWAMPESTIPPDPVPIPAKFRVRVISPTAVGTSPCIREILVGFCRDCQPETRPVESSNPPSECSQTFEGEIPVSGNVTYNVTDLDPYSTYKLLWHPEGGDVTSGTVTTIHTTIEEPSYIDPPTVNMLESDRIELCWGPPHPYPGPVNYTIHVYDDQVDAETWADVLLLQTIPGGLKRSNRTCVKITGILPFWYYRAMVNATNQLGSTESNSTLFRTPETEPGRVENFAVEEIPDNYSAIRLHWDPPPIADRNGNITGFVIRYRAQQGTANDSGVIEDTVFYGKPGQTMTEGHLTTDIPIRPLYNYTFEVAAVTEGGLEGNITDTTFSTRPGPPPVMPEGSPPVITQVTGQSLEDAFMVSLNPHFFTDNSHGEIIDYGLIVKAANQETGSVSNSSYPPEYYSSYNNWEAARYQEFAPYRVTPRKWQMNSYKNQMVYVIGSGENCTGAPNEFCNGPLDTPTAYSVKGFTCTEAGCTETDFYDGFQAGPLHCASSASNPKVHQREDGLTELELALIVVVAILALLLIIFIILILILCLRKQRQKEGRLIKGEFNDGHDTMVKGQHMGLTKM